jgi:anti-sigma regulatory factor (Ser/Thr protein kinase)
LANPQSGTNRSVQEARWTTTPHPSNVAPLRRALQAYAVSSGLDAHRVQDLTLAVSEIIANSVLHAFRDGTDGSITVDASQCEDGLRIRIADDGIGLSPRTDSPGAGLGLVIAGNVADRLEIDRPERGGTEVSLVFANAA